MDGRALVQERRLRFGLLDQADGESRPVRRGRHPGRGRPARQPLAGAPAVATARRGRHRIAARLRRPASTRPPRRPASPGAAVRFALRGWSWCLRPAACGGLRYRRPAGPVAAGRRRAGRPGDPRRHHGRRVGRRCLADRAAVGPPGPVLAGRGDAGHRPDLRQGHQLLPVRAAVPAPGPGPVQRPGRGGPAHLAGAVPGRRIARRPRLHDPGPRPPRCPGRAVPAVGGVRLPARQVRSGLQHAGHRDRRQLHRPERAVPRLRRADRHLRDRRGAARRRRLHPDALAARSDDRGLVPRVAGHRAALSRGDPALHGRTEPVRPGSSATSATTSR